MGIKSIIRKNVPNYSQAQVIAADLIHVRDNDNPGATLSWSGNSYSGARRHEDGMYILMHWDTVIAAVYYEPRVEKLVMDYFNARYISATTRGFQSRILKAFDKMGVWGTKTAATELGKPTHKRGVILNHDMEFVIA